MEQLTFLSAAPPASPLVSRDCGAAWMTRVATWRLNISSWLKDAAPAGASGKMSPVYF